MTAFVAIIALVLGVISLQKIGELRRQLERLEEELERIAAASAPGAPAHPAEASSPLPPSPPPRPATPALPVPPPAAAPVPASKPAPPPVPPPPPVRVEAPAAARASAPGLESAPASTTSNRGWEEFLGGRVLVWLGALAMALGVVFLVRQFAGHLWLKPEFRIGAGAFLGVALLAAGEALRRRASGVASGSSAAGIAALFAVAYAATGVYRLIPPAVGFAFLALVAFTGVLLSLRQGVLVAILGLVGGMVTPALVSSNEPRPALLFGYLLLLQGAVFAVSKRGGWWLLTLVNLVGGLLWVAAWLLGPYAGGDSKWLGLFLLASTAVAVFTARGHLAESADAGPAHPFDLRDVLFGGACLGGLMALAGVVVRSGFGATEWAFVLILAAATLALAVWQPRYRVLAPLVGAQLVTLLAAWGMQGIEQHLGLYFGVLLSVLVLFAAVPWFVHLRRVGDRLFIVLAAVTLVALPVLAHVATLSLELPVSRGLATLVLAGLAIAGAVPLAQRRVLENSTVPLGAFAAAATSLVALAIPLELSGPWWSVGWALEVPALAWLATRLRLPLLGRLAVLLAGAVVVRLTLNPYVWSDPLGPSPIVNGLLYGYGVPVAALVAAGVLAGRRGSRRQAVALEAGTVAVTFVWLLRAVHQYFHRGEAERFVFLEWAWVAGLFALLGFGLVLRAQRRGRFGSEVVGFGALGLASLTILVAMSALGADPVGEWPLVNGLLMAFGVPAMVFAALALRRRIQREGLDPRPILFGILALGLTFAWLTLEVRRWFRGALLFTGDGSNAEGFAYSLAWMVLGAALLVFGLRRSRFALRLAGLGVLALAAVKVFLYDVAGLGDLYRVLSFLGLGASLLGLGYLYQRFVRSSP